MKTLTVLTMCLIMSLTSVSKEKNNIEEGNRTTFKTENEIMTIESDFGFMQRSFWEDDIDETYLNGKLQNSAEYKQSEITDREHLEIGFNDEVYFYMEHNAPIVLEVFDITGRKVVSENREYAAGMHYITLQDGSGLYFVKLRDQSCKRVSMVMKLK